MTQGAASMHYWWTALSQQTCWIRFALIWISSEAVARSRPFDSCRPACFWTRSVWPKPDTVSQNQTGSGLVLHSVIQAVCRRMQLSLTVGDCSRPFDSCRPACFWTRSVWPKPDTVSQNQTGSGLVLHSVIQAGCRRTQLSLTVGDCSRPFVFCQNRAWWFLDTGLLLDQRCLAKTWPGHPDWIRASFAQ